MYISKPNTSLIKNAIYDDTLALHIHGNIMPLIENIYENAALLKLPPNARDMAEHLLSVTPLSHLLLMLEQNTPDQALLYEHKVPESAWQDSVKAALLAKTTYFLLNEKFNKEELLYLIKTACLSVNRPLNVYSIKEVMDMSRTDYPILVQWLKTYIKALKEKA